MTADKWKATPSQGWGVLELGASRQEVLERVRQANIEFEDDEGDPEWVILDEIDAELWFSDEEPFALLEIKIQNDDVRLYGQSVIGKRLHNVLVNLKASFDDTLWRMDADPTESLNNDEASSLDKKFSDEDLFRRGTLWVRSLGVGLWMADGEVEQLLLRQPQRVPAAGLGSITPAQLELSEREDLADRLGYQVTSAARWNWIQRSATGFLVIALAFIGYLGIQEDRRWATAEQAEGKVLKIEPPEKSTERPRYLVAYKLDDGVERQAYLSGADLYIPREVGETVPLAYLKEAPDKPFGVAHMRDRGFLQYMPWAMAAVMMYTVIMCVEPFLRRFIAAEPA